MAAEPIGRKRKREDEDLACGMCHDVPERSVRLACGHVLCPAHGMPEMCPTCRAPIRKAISRFVHENWAVERLVARFGGHDGERWTNQRSVYVSSVSRVVRALTCWPAQVH